MLKRGSKCLPLTNTLAYRTRGSMLAWTGFVTLAPGYLLRQQLSGWIKCVKLMWKLCRSRIHKTLFFVTSLPTKLECLSQADLSRLVYCWRVSPWAYPRANKIWVFVPADLSRLLYCLRVSPWAYPRGKDLKGAPFGKATALLENISLGWKDCHGLTL